MTLTPYLMPMRLFTALARGEDAPSAVTLLQSAQYSKHLLLVKAVVDEAHRRGHPQAGAARDGYTLLAHLQRRVPAAVADVIRYPAVGLWALRTLWYLTQGRPPEECGAAQPRRLATLAVSAAGRSGTDLTAELHTEGATISLPSVGRATLPGVGDGTPVRARVHDGGLELAAGRARVVVPLGDARAKRGDTGGWHGVRRLTEGWNVLLDDVDPFRFPVGPRQCDRLPDDDVPRWEEVLTAGRRLLVAHHPLVATEVERLVSVLVPLVPIAQPMTSASTRAAFGCVAMSRPPDARQAALTLAHEVQHVKLSALMDLFPLAHPSPKRLFYAPWRDDPRPLIGLLHGTYAFTGVAAFWSRQRHAEPDATAELEAHIQFARWRQAALEAAVTLLDSGCLLPLGRVFVTELLTTLHRLNDEDVPAEALTRARRAAARHRAHWQARHGHSPRQA